MNILGVACVNTVLSSSILSLSNEFIILRAFLQPLDALVLSKLNISAISLTVLGCSLTLQET